MPKFNIQILVEYEIEADEFDNVEDIFEEAINLYALNKYVDVVEYLDHQVMSIGEVKQ